MKNSEELIDNFLHGSLDEHGQAELRAWLKRDPANMRQFTRELMFDEQIRATIHAKETGSALHPLTGAGGLTDQATSGKIIPFTQYLLGKLPWFAAAAALVVIFLSVWKTIAPPSSAPPPLAKLDARWVLEPTAGADYRVLNPNRVKLLKGELRLHSLQPASMVVETPGATATAQGTDFLIGTHVDESKVHTQPNHLERNHKMKLKPNMQNLTRVLVFTGVVTLSNVHGETAGKASELLVAEAGKAPVNHALTANSHFALVLYGQLAKENPGENLFFSPYSMSSALAMTAEGARGETAAEMGKVLGFPDAAKRMGDDAQLLPWNTALIHTGMKVLNEKFQKMEPYEVRVANALYGEKTYPFRAEYMDTINKFYNTGAFMPVDFKGNGEAVRLQINGWVEKQTRERIKDLLKEGTVDERTRLVLVNAIYFKGDWAVSFEAKETKAEDFLADGVKKVNVPMMRNDLLEGGRYGAFKADGSLFATPQRVMVRDWERDPAPVYPGKGGFQVAELPYKGGELSMALIVPQDADGLAAVEKELTSAKLAAWLGQLEGRDMNVQMPKFKMETDYPAMANTLQALGMKQAFDPSRANFDGMCASGSARLYISKVAHKAFVEVNEQGTEAAAATAVAMTFASEDKPFTPTVRADRPFLFAIRDVKTGTILFVGRMVDPTSTAPQTAGK